MDYQFSIDNLQIYFPTVISKIIIDYITNSEMTLHYICSAIEKNLIYDEKNAHKYSNNYTRIYNLPIIDNYIKENYPQLITNSKHGDIIIDLPVSISESDKIYYVWKLPHWKVISSEIVSEIVSEIKTRKYIHDEYVPHWFNPIEDFPINYWHIKKNIIYYFDIIKVCNYYELNNKKFEHGSDYNHIHEFILSKYKYEIGSRAFIYYGSGVIVNLPITLKKCNSFGHTDCVIFTYNNIIYHCTYRGKNINQYLVNNMSHLIIDIYNYTNVWELSIDSGLIEYC